MIDGALNDPKSRQILEFYLKKAFSDIVLARSEDKIKEEVNKAMSRLETNGIDRVSEKDFAFKW